MDAAIILGLIGLLLIFGVLVAILFDPQLLAGAAVGLGGSCHQTADCRGGLVCSKTFDPNFPQNGACLIPERGSCYGQPNFCEGGTGCVEGICVQLLQDVPTQGDPESAAIRLMSPATEVSTILQSRVPRRSQIPPQLPQPKPQPPQPPQPPKPQQPQLPRPTQQPQRSSRIWPPVFTSVWPPVIEDCSDGQEC